MYVVAIIILVAVALLTIFMIWHSNQARKLDQFTILEKHEPHASSNWQDPIVDSNELDEIVSPARVVSTKSPDDLSLSALGFGGVDEVLKPTPTRLKQPNKQRETYLPNDEDLVIIHVKALPGSVFSGYGLQQALMAAGLRFGELSIFHRYEFDNGKERILFSVASAVEPGVFDLQRIGGFSTPGLSIFMTIANCSDPVKTFEILLETAQQLADDLGGELQDQHRKLFTQDTADEYRARVKELAVI